VIALELADLVVPASRTLDTKDVADWLAPRFGPAAVPPPS
jgi:hypothetical protein